MENLCLKDAFRDELNKNLCLKMHLGMYTVWPQMVQGGWGGCTLSGHRWCTRGRGGQSVFVSYRDNFLGCGGGGGSQFFVTNCLCCIWHCGFWTTFVLFRHMTL